MFGLFKGFTTPEFSGPISKFFRDFIYRFKKIHTIAFLICFFCDCLKMIYYITVARYTVNTNFFVHLAVYLDVLITPVILVVSGPLLSFLLTGSSKAGGGTKKIGNGIIIFLITAASCLHFVWSIISCVFYGITIFHVDQAWSIGHVFTIPHEYGGMLGFGFIFNPIINITVSFIKSAYSLYILLIWSGVLNSWSLIKDDEEFRSLVVSGKVQAPMTFKQWVKDGDLAGEELLGNEDDSGGVF